MTTKKITQLTSASLIDATDIVPLVTDVGGAPLTEYITGGNLFSASGVHSLSLHTDMGIITSASDSHTEALHTGLGLQGSDGWTPDSDTWTYVSSTSFKVSGKDVTAKFPTGTKIKLTQTTAKYFYVVSSSFSTDTTITVTGGTDYTVANATITSPNYSYASSPRGFPHYFNYTPTVTSSAGTITSTSITHASFFMIGKTVSVRASISITNNGTGSGYLKATLPVTAGDTYAWGNGREYATGGKMLQVSIESSQMAVRNYDNSYPAATGYGIGIYLSYSV